MLGYLARVASVIGFGAPALVLLAGLVASAATLWGTGLAVMEVITDFSTWFTELAGLLGTYIDSITRITEGPEFGAAPNLMWFMMTVCGFDKLMEWVADSFTVAAAVLTAVAGLMTTICVAAIAAWAYRKARLFGNIASGVGIDEG